MDPVIIKSYPGGLRLKMDPQVDFPTICESAREHFSSAKSFFRDASVALTFEGRVLSEEEENTIAAIIEEETSLRILLIYGCNPESQELNMRALSVFYDNLIKAQQAAGEPKEQNVEIHYGSLSEGTSLDCSRNLLLIGDVPEGSEVTSEKNIMVLGRLHGNVYAGSGTGGKHFVFAYEMDPLRMQIDGMRYRRPHKEHKEEKKGFFFKKDKSDNTAQPAGCYAYVENGEVILSEKIPEAPFTDV